jgi:tRNA nucleotidyltransferase (CCA-adding enzyme)
MVGNRPMPSAEKPKESLAEAAERVYPELQAVREAASEPVYLVGGAVRDLLLGRGRADIDLVVEGDANALASRLGADVVSHERFSTAKVRLDGHEVDIASARTESYPHPGSLPVVETATRVEADLARRDFTINAMALPLLGGPELIDPHGGRADLAAGQLRVLHPGSFADDPTRALRAARYAARFDFGLEQGTAALLRDADLGTVSADRREAELLRLAAEAEAVRALSLATEWGLVTPREGGVELAATVAGLLRSAPWAGFVARDRALLVAGLGPAGGEEALAGERPGSPSEAVGLAAGHDPVELVLARALGAEWLDRYLSEWREVRLEIDGEALIAAGIPQGPALGRGLGAALRRKLDGEIAGREQELEAALEVARGSDGGTGG